MSIEHNTVLLSCGSNLGQPLRHCQQTVAKLEADPDLKIIAVSSLYLTEPVSSIDQPWFYNFAMKLETKLTAEILIQRCMTFELELGRQRDISGGPRTIDIDIIYFDRQIIDTSSLIVPHPRLYERKFVLVPLAEISPEFIDPVRNRSIKKLLIECPDRQAIILYEKDWLTPQRKTSAEKLSEPVRTGVS